MQRDPRTWLWDVREAANAIDEFVTGLDRSHGYALVDHDTVWGVIRHSLPALREAVSALLQQLDSGGRSA